jgi:hypothetical protein
LTNQIYVTNGSNNMTNVFNPPISRWSLLFLKIKDNKIV